MIRLYPQVTKSEDSITELRRQLGKAESQSLEQHSQLSDAERQITTLHKELDATKQEHETLLLRLVEAEKATEVFRGTAKSAQCDEEQRVCVVRNLEARHRDTLGELARSEAAQAEVFDETTRFREELAEMQNSIQATARQRSDLLSRLAANSRKQATGQLQWEGIVKAVKDQRAQLASLRSVVAEQTSHTQEDVGVLTELRDAVLRMESEERHLREEIAPLHGWDTKYFALRAQLDEANSVLGGLWTSLGSEDYEAQRFRGELQSTEQASSDLEAALSSAIEECAQQDLQHTESRALAASASSQLEEAEQATVMLRVSLTREEQEEHRFRTETQGAIEHLRSERAGLTPREAELQQECSRLRGQLEQAESQGRGLQSKADEREKSCSDMAAQNAELDQTLQELKKKGGCTIS